MSNSPACRPDKRISDFIGEQRILTLATSGDNTPHCAICYYVYLQEFNCLVFKSNVESRHIQEGLKNEMVGVSIVSSSRLKINGSKGVQIEGWLKAVNTHPGAVQARSFYYKHYPIALAIAGELFVIELARIKFIDNSLGFGTKLSWEKFAGPLNG
jgi:uncharacterized protein YhbP (UPF0306 family)